MISVILYGRNDQHGYQYQKRVAISINALAAMLTATQDEILFVDYNTRDDLPTLLESIQDTLTDKAKLCLKIFRIRQSHHQARFKNKMTLEVVEAWARNVAIRFSNPLNRWVLSTNTDMIFVSQHVTDSLTSIIANLPDGFYVLPRYELPEYLWDSQFVRDQPAYNMTILREHAKALHLHKIIRQTAGVEYDNVGDFQLMLRKDIFDIGGFNENMILGWHVDANLNKRMAILYQQVTTLTDQLFGYHCNHTREETFSHSAFRLENSWYKYVTKVNSPLANENIAWGLAETKIEEISLTESRKPGKHYFDVLYALQKQSEVKQYEMLIHTDHFNQYHYASAQVFPYLADCLANKDKNTSIVYVGYNHVMVNLLLAFIPQMGFVKNLVLVKNTIHTEPNTVYIFDFGFDNTMVLQSKPEQKIQLKKVMQCMLATIKREKNKKYVNTFIGINVLYTDFRAIFRTKIVSAVTSHNANISYGYVKLPSQGSFWNKIYSFSARLKMNFLQSAHYFVVRYFFNEADVIRKLFIRSPWAKYFIKTHA